jgi:tagaturonate reductase
MEPVNASVKKARRPVKILQYGEGNFLRAFVGYMTDIANEKAEFGGNIQIVKPIEYGNLDAFKEQDCVYTVLLRGKRDGAAYVEKRVVTSVSRACCAYRDYEEYAAFAKSPELRLIVSNTTEAGIVYDESDRIELNPPKTYPGKLTKFLYERYLAFEGSEQAGVIVLPVELIEKNGAKLKDCCLRLAALWKLPEGFSRWLGTTNVFCNTLVDRIVTGYPKDEIESLQAELGYSDKLLVAAEPFALWVIESECPEIVAQAFPLDKAGLPVLFVKDYVPYRERKVRLLNGAHTASALAAYLAGVETVGGLMRDKTMRAFLERALFGELAPMVPLPPDEVGRFAQSVIERFENPFIKHNLLSIAMNSVSKFKARVLPTIKETARRDGKPPEALSFSLAALCAFYCGEGYEKFDDSPVLEFFAENRGLAPAEMSKALLSREDFWGEDLTQTPMLQEAVANGLENIEKLGMRGAVERVLNKNTIFEI